ncbi:MAG: AbrB/MazE/SpoVT family DNA-binding domain-containing protein [Chloroflexi bacterium]|nr:AbrB/MazE/SpoVT family DNA-binding domain-containing protein [Chloroflexota bacterium]
MAKEEKMDCCSMPDQGMGCCRVESVISIDERGQMVLPKEVREKAGIHPGDKIAVITWGRGEKASCICLIKAEEFAEMVKGILGPMFKEMVQ